jgi:hypothetical protein
MTECAGVTFSSVSIMPFWNQNGSWRTSESPPPGSKRDYETALKDKIFVFELDAMDHLSSFLVVCDQRTDG